MSASSYPYPEPVFVCALGFYEACAGESCYGEHEGERYCVLHFPGEKKDSDFDKALQKKLNNKYFNFKRVWFPDDISFQLFEFTEEADFSYAVFSETVDFSGAKFPAGADFLDARFSAAADFSSAKFKGAYFGYARFSAAVDFSYAEFSARANFGSARFSAAADFHEANFSAVADFHKADFGAEANFQQANFGAEAYFPEANFSPANFSYATFSAYASFIAASFSAMANFSSASLSAKANFDEAVFADHLRFAGSESRVLFTLRSSLSLRFARIEKPDHVAFHALTLRPHWFVNVDARNFDLSNVDWVWRTVNEEINRLCENKVSSPHNELFIACRRLADNAEENHRYEEASRFRYMAMEARRLESWRGFAPWRLSWWYWLASGYGERVWQAFFVLLGILLLSALLYTQVGFARWEPKVGNESDVIVAKRDELGAPLRFSRALTYSLGVMILQKPEPRPATTAAQTVVLFETVLGPVQAALLALAIRRKFMR